MGNVPEHGPGAAGRQPHRRQHVARGDRPAARLLDLLRRRAAASTSSPTTWSSPRRSGPFLRRYGTVAASHEHAEEALDAGAAVLVFPGGDWEVHRPSWERNKVDFAGRKGFIQLALDAGRADRPGGHDRRPGDGALPQPRRLAGEAAPAPTACCASRCCRSRSRCPGASTSATCSATSRCRRRSRSRSWPPIDLREQFGAEPDVDEVYDHVTGLMQETLDGARRRAALPGDRLMRPERVDRRLRPAEAGLGLHRRARQRAPLHVRHHPLGGRGRAADRASAPATGC